MNQSMTMNESQVNFGKNIDNGKQSGIIEERSDREVNYKQNPSIGRMEGSYPSGGSSGSSGGSSSGDVSNKQRLQEMIKNGEVTLKINEYKSYLAIGIEKSYFTVPQSELQDILYNKNTTGSIRIDKSGVAREIFDCGKPVAYDTNLKRNTSFVKVHYSKEKTHLSPHTPNRRNE